MSTRKEVQDAIWELLDATDRLNSARTESENTASESNLADYQKAYDRQNDKMESVVSFCRPANEKATKWCDSACPTFPTLCRHIENELAEQVSTAWGLAVFDASERMRSTESAYHSNPSSRNEAKWDAATVVYLALVELSKNAQKVAINSR